MINRAVILLVVLPEWLPIKSICQNSQQDVIQKLFEDDYKFQLEIMINNILEE